MGCLKSSHLYTPRSPGMSNPALNPTGVSDLPDRQLLLLIKAVFYLEEEKTLLDRGP